MVTGILETIFFKYVDEDEYVTLQWCKNKIVALNLLSV